MSIRLFFLIGPSTAGKNIIYTEVTQVPVGYEDPATVYGYILTVC